jgi:protein phosphatase
MLRVSVAAKTDIGTVRSNNEDSFGFDTRCAIFVVSDGMGGARAGEVASSLAVRTVLEQMSKGKDREIAGGTWAELSPQSRSLALATRQANQSVHEWAAVNQSCAGMGATLVGVSVNGNQVTIAHVGDSRAYLLRDGVLHQITQDHSFVAEQVRRGILTAEEGMRSELQNVITRALGAEESVDPDIEELAAKPNDLLVLVTDGLTKAVTDSGILEILKREHSLDAACNALIEAAKTNGSDDNITCMLLRFDRRPWYWPVARRRQSIPRIPEAVAAAPSFG